MVCTNICKVHFKWTLLLIKNTALETLDISAPNPHPSNVFFPHGPLEPWNCLLLTTTPPQHPLPLTASPLAVYVRVVSGAIAVPWCGLELMNSLQGQSWLQRDLSSLCDSCWAGQLIQRCWLICTSWRGILFITQINCKQDCVSSALGHGSLIISSSFPLFSSSLSFLSVPRSPLHFTLSFFNSNKNIITIFVPLSLFCPHDATWYTLEVLSAGTNQPGWACMCEASLRPQEGAFVFL